VNIVILLFILSLLKCTNVIFKLAYIIVLAEKYMLKLATAKACDVKGDVLDWYTVFMITAVPCYKFALSCSQTFFQQW